MLVSTPRIPYTTVVNCLAATVAWGGGCVYTTVHCTALLLLVPTAAAAVHGFWYMTKTCHHRLQPTRAEDNILKAKSKTLMTIW